MNNYKIRRTSADSLLVISQASDPDLDALDEQLWDRYLAQCELENLKPSYSDFKLWCQELAD